jgi:hypothetical protein
VCQWRASFGRTLLSSLGLFLGCFLAPLFQLLPPIP